MPANKAERNANKIHIMPPKAIPRAHYFATGSFNGSKFIIPHLPQTGKKPFRTSDQREKQCRLVKRKP